MSGRVLSERYELVERLGAGGMAEVHRARDRLLHREVAVKVLAPHLADDDDLVRRFEREARSAASLNHPNVVAVHDTGADGDVHFIVMELIEGPTLETVIAERGSLPVDEVIDIAGQVCAGLEAAHAAGLIHRDIKPGNIMFDASGGVKVTDFGIALATAESRLTRTSSVYGSARYLSPEQARGGDVDERADIYGLGCVVYAMLTGQGPFTAPEPVAVVYQHLHGDLEPPSARRDGVPDALDAVVVRMLARDRSDRYGSAREVRRELDRVARGGTPEAAAAGLAATRRLDDDETLAMSPAGDGGGPVAGGDVDGGAPGAGTDDVSHSVSDDVSDDGRRPVWRTGLVVVAALVLFAAMLAATVLRSDTGSDARPLAATPTSASPTPDPTPSPSPPASLEQTAVSLYEAVVVGQQRGELSDKAAEELRKRAEEALGKYRDGELEEALEKLDEGRRKVGELTREGEIEPERSRAILGALDRVEESLRREAPPPDEDDGENDEGGENEREQDEENERKTEQENENEDERGRQDDERGGDD